MPNNLTQEMQYLTALPIAELLRELDRCRDRVLERLEAAASGVAASPVAAPTVAETMPQPASAASASPPEPATSALITPAPPPAEILLTEITPQALTELSGDIRIVTAPAGVLQPALKECVPGKSPGDFAVMVDKEPMTGQDLIDMVETGDIRRTQPASMAVEDLKELLVGSAAAAAVPAAPVPAPAAPEPDPTEVLLMEVSPETLNGLAASIRTVTTPAGVLLHALKDCVPGKSPGDFAVTVDKEPITAQDLIDMVGTGDIRRTEPASMAVEDLKELLIGGAAGVPESALTAPASVASASAAEPTETLLMEVSPETLNGLAASIRTVTTPAGVLLHALKDCVPGKSPGDFAVTVDKEPITAQDLIDMVGTGDIRRTEPTSMAVEDLRELLVGSPPG